MTAVRKGQAPPKLTREAFGARFRALFMDPAYDSEPNVLDRLPALPRMR